MRLARFRHKAKGRIPFDPYHRRFPAAVAGDADLVIAAAGHLGIAGVELAVEQSDDVGDAVEGGGGRSLGSDQRNQLRDAIDHDVEDMVARRLRHREGGRDRLARHAGFGALDLDVHVRRSGCQ